MAGQLIKLLVASVYNLRVQLIFFDFILFFLILAIFWRWDPFSKMLFCRKKFPVHVVISVFQTFNYRCLEIFVCDIFFSLYFKAKIHWNKGMSDFNSGNSVFFGRKPTVYM